MKGFNYVKMLNEVSEKDFMMVGGKGANLGKMIEAQLPVPEGFVVLTGAYKRFVEENGLQEKIKVILNNASEDTLENAANEIKELFIEGIVPEEIIEEICKVYEKLDNQDVAVRSSATAEDMPETSFAGQYDTYLNIKGKDELIKHVKKCWASLWNGRAVAYRMKQNILEENLAHGVVVQKLVNSDKSGILFTANPVNGRRDQMLLNSSWGLGEAIVGGEVTPDQWVIDKNNGSIVEKNIAKKEVMTIRLDNGIELVKVPADKKNEISLNEKENKELLNLALKVEEYFGSPQDIEWAYEKEKFYLVQSRPITSLYPMPKIKENKDDLRIYINFNLYSQAMKEPFTPMGGDIVKKMLEGSLIELGKKDYKGDRIWWCQEIGGRLFFDITDFMRTDKSWNKFRKVDTADKDPITTKALLQLLERNKEEINKPKKQVSLLKQVNPRLLRVLASAAVKYMHGVISPVKARNKALELENSIINNLTNERKSLKTIENKLDFLENKGSIMFLDGFGIVTYVAVSSTYIEKAKKIMEKYLDDTSDLNHVEKSVPYSVTTEMGMEILNLAKVYDESGRRPKPEDKEIIEFLEKYGHRNTVEIEVGVPIWREDPKYVLDLINNYIDNQNYQESIDKFYKGKEDADKAIKRIKSKLEEKGKNSAAKKVEKMLKDFRSMFGIREQSKFFVRRFLTIYREILLEIGEELQNEGRLENKHDIFYVTIDDIRNSKDLQEIVIKNKETYERDHNISAPRLLTSTGESIYSAIQEAGENTLVGIPVSPGVYEGKVKILTKPEEGYKLEKGDILVTTGTNPAWTPLFLKLGALIMETGGPISHGSVVAREYGLPAVSGVAKATTTLKDGQKVKLNGETGIIEIV